MVACAGTLRGFGLLRRHNRGIACGGHPRKEYEAPRKGHEALRTPVASAFRNTHSTYRIFIVSSSAGDSSRPVSPSSRPGLTRRRLVAGAAWAAPVVVASSVIPAYAASDEEGE